MDIISITNTLQPNTISRFALKQTDIPNDETGLPFMGGYAVLFAGAKLPAESAVLAYAPTYTADLATAQAAQAASAALPDIHTQVAQLTAAVVALGGAIPDTQIEAANIKLAAVGRPAIETAIKSVKLA